jgi:lysophospholipase L1-like esterase
MLSPTEISQSSLRPRPAPSRPAAAARRRFRTTRGILLIALLLGVLLCPAPASAAGGLVGPKADYLALGDSLAFGYQPNFDWIHGYADQWFADLQRRQTKGYTNYGCPGETSATFINGGCPHAELKRSFYAGSQLAAAIAFLTAHQGKVSPVSLDIGANGMIRDLDPSTCTVGSGWDADLAAVDLNLTGVILPRLVAMLTDRRGARTGDLVMMNYYDPWQNECPNAVSYVEQLNQHLAADAAQFGVPIADVFTAFGGAATPNPNICADTWMCSVSHDIHATGGVPGEPGNGYGVIRRAFGQVTGY